MQESRYERAVRASLEGMIGVSTGACPGCAQCASDHGHDPDDEQSMSDFEARWRSGDACSEPHFSWSPCGICGSSLGGDREVWHWVHARADGTREIVHEDNACIDCVLYLANGDVPERWQEYPGDDRPD